MRAIAQFPELQLRIADAHGAGLADLLLEALRDGQRAPAVVADVDGDDDGDEAAEDGQDARGAIDVLPQEDRHGNPWESGEESAGWRCVPETRVPEGFRARCAELRDMLIPRALPHVPTACVTARRDVTIWHAGVDIDGYSDWRVVQALGPHWALVLEGSLPDGADVHPDSCDLRVLLVEAWTFEDEALTRVATARILPPRTAPRAAT